MQVFVTGAAGPLGRSLIELLTRQGHMVSGLVRRASGVAILRYYRVEPVLGDLTRVEALADAMRGCDVVFHLAHFFDFWSKNKTTFDRVNVEGTRNTVAAAAKARVPRVVFCSSSMTIGAPRGAWGDEDTPHSGHTHSAFERSTLRAERIALASRNNGTEVVVVNPALVVAPNDPGWTGRLIADCVSGHRMFASDTPVGWVSVSDTAHGCALAMEHGVDGRRYILSGDSLSPRTFLSIVARLAGQHAPHALPRSLAFGSALLATAMSAPFGRRPSLSLDEARFLTAGFRVDGTQAIVDLGMQYTPLARYLSPIVASYRTALRRFTAA